MGTVMTTTPPPEQPKELDKIITSLVDLGVAIATDQWQPTTEEIAKAAIERLLHRSNLEAQIKILRQLPVSNDIETEIVIEKQMADLQQQLTEMEK